MEGDIQDTDLLARTLQIHEPHTVIHFAASAYVGESVENPAKYYSNNVVGSLSLLEACRRTQTRKLIFSSSCATYGTPAKLPISETTPQNPISPYGRSKLMVEQIIVDYAAAYGLRYVALRYFNACGADPDGDLGEKHEPETHIIPCALYGPQRKVEAPIPLWRRSRNGRRNMRERLYPCDRLGSCSRASSRVSGKRK